MFSVHPTPTRRQLALGIPRSGRPWPKNPGDNRHPGSVGAGIRFVREGRTPPQQGTTSELGGGGATAQVTELCGGGARSLDKVFFRSWRWALPLQCYSSINNGMCLSDLGPKVCRRAQSCLTG